MTVVPVSRRNCARLRSKLFFAPCLLLTRTTVIVVVDEPLCPLSHRKDEYHFFVADLSKNRFSDLPEEVTEFPFLEKLHLYHNAIRIIPETVAMLQSLNYLDLRSVHMHLYLPARYRYRAYTSCVTVYRAHNSTDNAPCYVRETHAVL